MANAVDKDVAAINKTLKDHGVPFKSGDLDAFMEYFTDDVVWMPSGIFPLVGKQACLQWARESFGDTTIEELAVTSDEVVVSGDLAFDRIYIHMKTSPKAGGESERSGTKCIRILSRQDDGSWKVSRYIWNPAPVN